MPNEMDRFIWDRDDVTIRGATPDELRALGAQDWQPSKAPPFTSQPDNEVSGTDGTVAATREHGELGPVLVDGNHDFTAL